MNRIGTYIAVFLLGVAANWLLSWPLSIAGMLFWGTEISSQASFPGGHMARVYSLPGFGDQHLALEVDGSRVWESPDLEPGDIKGRAVWDLGGRSVSLVTNEQPIYTYNLTTRKGKTFIGKAAEEGEQ